jgi:hypothetical protein
VRSMSQKDALTAALAFARFGNCQFYASLRQGMTCAGDR